MSEIKQEVRQFYDQVGWQVIDNQAGDIYQNARYEDLRPVSYEYIHRCHLRIARHLKPSGRYLLDAGSGPVQYPEYLEYSRRYRYRVCADISLTALQEARKRLGEHGLYVVMDIANLPFKADTFDGIVSLHTIHHLPEEEHLQAYRELYRVLAPGSRGAVVNGWPTSKLMDRFEPLIRIAHRIRAARYRLGPQTAHDGSQAAPGKQPQAGSQQPESGAQAKGTFTSRHDLAWIKNEVGAFMPVEVRVWRSVSVRFLRALIHPKLAGRAWLKLLWRLEERYPHYFGANGKYPLIIIQKNADRSVQSSLPGVS